MKSNLTAEDVYTLACSLLLEKTGQDNDWELHFLPLLNLLLVESYPAARSLAEAEGEILLPFTAQNPTSVIPYDDAIVRLALPFGLAASFCRDNGDGLWAQEFQNRYLDALTFASHAVAFPMTDVY